MTDDKLLPVEERFRMLMRNIQAGLAIFSASLVLKRETGENGNDAANLYAVFDDAPEKPMFIMKAVRGMASIRRFPIALDTNVPEQTSVKVD